MKGSLKLRGILIVDIESSSDESSNDAGMTKLGCSVQGFDEPGITSHEGMLRNNAFDQ